jgi:benzoate-CoA ligase family protein
MTFPYAVGASTILHPGRPTPEVAFELIERFKPTIFFAVPTIYVPMLAMENAKARDLSSLRLCISAAEALPPAVYQEWLANYGVEIVEGLGSTEVLHIYLSNYPGRVKTGATGTNVPGYELKLVDGDGQTVGPGETGDMMVRGLSTAPYYWNRPEKTEYTMRDDWIFTGDRFYQDEDGYFHFNGRSDEMMKVSGQWVSPVEVEQTLARHPAVLESAVIAVKNEAGLVRSKAFIALHADYQPSEALTRELQTFVKGELAPYKYPRLIEFVAELPKTGTNKIDRMKIKQMEEK